MQPITVNTTDLELRRMREALLAGTPGALDAKRPDAWATYGYPTEVGTVALRIAYERTGAGRGAVHRLLDKCWQERPRIKRPDTDEVTPWETSVDKLLTAISGWQKLRDWDRRNMVGCFAGLILRVGDGKALREPLQRAARLVDLVPVYEEQLKVTAWDSDPASETFGTPTMWQYRTQPVQRQGDTQAQPEQWVDVHPSRIHLLAEGSVGSPFDGVPLLRAGYNSLVDLEKITGGSAESFLKNSARTVVFKYDAASSPQAITDNPDGTPSGKTVREAHEEQTRSLNRNIDSSIVIQGGDAATLQTTIADPTKAFEVAACTFAASVQIPFTVLFGQQTGRLASDEDKADMVARCKSRQINELTPAIERLVRSLQAAGLIEGGEFEVEWPPLDSPGDDAKADLLGKMTSAMQQAFQAGLTEPLFDANELRGVLDYEERTDDGMPQEGDPADDPNADPAADPAAGPPALQRVA